MKHFLYFLTMALLIVSVTACNNDQTKVPELVSPVQLPNLETLESYVNKAPKTNDPQDQYFAANYYLEQHTAADTTKAIELLIKSAEQEYAHAATQLGNIYSADSTGSFYDLQKAVEYYEQGVKNGSDRSMTNLANLYINGKGVEKDYKKAMQLRTDALLGLLSLAEEGDAAAQERLGYNLVWGVGVPGNSIEGVKWIKKAADKGYNQALYRMGICYKYGYGDLQKDPKEAFYYFKRAAENDENVYALNELASCYKSGFGVELNQSSAFENYLKAAKLGNTDAMFEVAYAYQQGIGTSVDYTEAFHWYKKCAERGHSTAQNNIGSMYQSGQGVARDDKEGFKWFLKAANSGSAWSQRVVGSCYLDGKGVEKDANKAFEWFKKSAEGGDNNGKYCCPIKIFEVRKN